MKYLIIIILSLILFSCDENPIESKSRIDTLYNISTVYDTVYNIDTIVFEDNISFYVDSAEFDSTKNLLPIKLYDSDTSSWYINVPWYNESCNIRLFLSRIYSEEEVEKFGGENNYEEVKLNSNDIFFYNESYYIRVILQQFVFINTGPSNYKYKYKLVAICKDN